MKLAELSKSPCLSCAASIINDPMTAWNKLSAKLWLGIYRCLLRMEYHLWGPWGRGKSSVLLFFDLLCRGRRRRLRGWKVRAALAVGNGGSTGGTILGLVAEIQHRATSSRLTETGGWSSSVAVTGNGGDWIQLPLFVVH
ncbi:hypothetical protein BHE74_00029189 [Ensete ventricosum]|nr:hypothetical protein BHE74_00029189 [Ensete ventricosum]